MNVYDLAVKGDTKEFEKKNLERNIVEKAQEETTVEFYQYLMQI